MTTLKTVLLFVTMGGVILPKASGSACVELSQNSTVAEHNMAWTCEQINWRNALAEWKKLAEERWPLAPNSLNLRSFDTLVLTMEGPLFGDMEFTVETYGVEASWDAPTDGISECYHAEISYAESGQVVPADNGQESIGEPLRQFINLIPGRTYTVTVYAATCGQGHLGVLRSDPISEDIFVPPAPPPDVVHEETTTTVELTWGPPESEYDDFEVIETTVLDSRVTVEDEVNKTRLGRTVTGLQPCTQYDFEIYSIYRGLRSESPTRVSVLTRPLNDVIVSVASFDETSVTFDLQSPSNAVVQYELTLLPSGQTIRTNGSQVTFTGLTPGLTYSVSTTTSCRQDETVTSTEIITTVQTTKPPPPSEVTVECRPIGINQTESDLYHEVEIPWSVPEYSRMTLTWPLPESGTWDNFVVDYSPYVFEEGLSSPQGPILLPADTTTITVDVPITGRVMSVSVRSLSNNVLSEPDVRSAVCGGDAILRCRSYLAFWNIIITPIENNQLRVEIPDFPIRNATVYVGGQVSVFFVNTFVIPNPCETRPSSRIVVYPRCPDILPFCPVIVRPICPRSRTKSGIGFVDACCHNRLYNTENQICCRNKLIRIDGRTNEQCCFRGWYNSETNKCCRNGDTVLTDGVCPAS